MNAETTLTAPPAKAQKMGAAGIEGCKAKPLVVESRGLCWEARGTREQLLSAGLCTPAHFPVGRMRSAHGESPDGQRWTLSKIRRSDQWQLWVRPTDAQIAAIQANGKDIERERQEREIASKRLNLTPEKWRQDRLHLLDDLVLPMVRTTFHQFGYKAARRFAVEHICSRIRDLMASTPIEVDEVAQAEYRATLEATGGTTEAMPRLRAPLRLVACHG